MSTENNTTEATEKKVKSLITDLKSSNDELVIKSLEELRKIGDHSCIVPIINLLIDTDNDDISELITSLLNDLKDDAAIQPLIDAIQDPQYEQIQRKLVEAFWQSNLDASEHIGVFVDLALTADYLVCLECVTVIENLEGPFDDEALMELIQTVNQAIAIQRTHKNKLLEELAGVLNRLVVG